MKKTTFTLCLMFFYCLTSLAQQKNSNQKTSKNSHQEFELTAETINSINTTGYARCLTDENEIALRKQFPNRSTTQEFEEWLAPKVAKIQADRLAGRTSMAVFNIPVVIHVIHNGDAIGTGENITDAQALSQIQVMNEDFRRLAGTRGGSNTTGVAVDVELNFCIAQVDASGAATTGVVRHNITPYSNDVADGAGGADWENRADTEQMKVATQWDPTKYLNMWTIRAGGLPVNSGGQSGLLGYAQFPDNTPGIGGINPSGGSANTDGVVASFDAMGTNDSNDGTFLLNPTYNLGRTMTHEVGHWLGLRHIWGDGPQTGSCGVDDFCADTPNTADPNYTCDLTADSCTSSTGIDQVQNYMDYTNDACMDTFTQNQKDRIQAIMGASPRRVELNTSTACTVEPTIYISSTLLENINEGSDCDFTDVVIDLSIATAASATATVNLTNSGTATENEDFEFINNSVTIAAGATTTSNSITLRVFNDSFVEADETINIAINVTTTGDAVASTNNYITTILNDDFAVGDTAEITHFSDNFDDEDISDWTLTDSDGDGNNWGDIFAINNTAGTPVTPVSLISRSWQTNPLTPDNWAVSPVIDLSSASGTITLNWITQVAAASFDLEKYSIHVGTVNDISVLINSTTSLTETLGDVGNTGAPTPHTLDLSAMAGQAQVYIAFRHWDTTDQDFISIDDVTVTSTVGIDVQTTVNNGTLASNNLNAAGNAFYTDTASGNIMLDIDNTGGFDYACTTAEVSRDAATAGADAVMYVGGTDPSSFVTAKTFDITSVNSNTTDQTTVTFYFTESEISGWETVTGNSRNDLYAKNEDTADVTSLSITPFGTGSKLTGTFNTGVAGTYYFGTQFSLLSTNDVSFDNSFEIYPNPNNGSFNVKLTSTSNNISVKVYDVRGRSVFNKAYSNSGAFNENINIGNVQSGLYLLNVNDGGRTVTKKIIVE